MAVEQVARWPWNAWPDESGLGGRMAWNPQANLAANCLPDDLAAYQPEQFETFLTERRRLMAQKIKQYYWGL